MSKKRIIDVFLRSLKLRRDSNALEFDIFCGRCGSGDCQVIIFPDVWQGEGSILDRGAVGMKCANCGISCAVKYEEGALYG